MVSNVDKIKERLSIVDVIGSYITIQKVGKNFKAKCPFHDDKSPSFSVSPDRGLYYCFGCGAKGDMFTFTQEFEGVDFQGALKLLADRAGIELAQEDPKARDLREKLLDVLETAALFFEERYVSEKSARSYVADRSISEKTAKEWRIGYAPDGWRELFDFFQAKNIDAELLVQAGLAKKKEQGGFYDVFRGRIIFPIFDPSGRVIAFTGRQLKSQENSPKYLNSPDTVLFDKSRTLYGLHNAKDSIRKQNYSILVEGQVDIIMSHQAGLLHTVASSGTAVTEEHLARLKMLSPNIILAFDSDEAGVKAARRTTEHALTLGMQVKIVQLPEGSDPADLIEKDVDTYKLALKKASFAIEFFLDHVLSKSGVSQQQQMSQVRTLILPLISLLNSRMEQERAAEGIAKRLGISKESVLSDARTLEVGIEPRELRKEKPGTKDSPEREILGIVLWQQSLEKPVIDVEQIITELKRVVGEEYFRRLMARAREIGGELVFEMEDRYGDELSEEKVVAIVDRLKDKSKRKHITELQKHIREAEESGDERRLEALLEEFNKDVRTLHDDL